MIGLGGALEGSSADGSVLLPTASASCLPLARVPISSTVDPVPIHSTAAARAKSIACTIVCEGSISAAA